MHNVSMTRRNGWRPAPFNPIAGMGQAQGSAFLDDPMLATAFDLVATGTSGYVAWGMARANSPWMPFWLVLATAMGVKTLHDLSRVKS